MSDLHPIFSLVSEVKNIASAIRNAFRKQTLQPVALAPMTANGYMQDLDGVAAIILRNNGSNVVNLWQGKYSLQQYETVSFNVTEAGLADMEFYQVPVQFVGAGTSQLQIVLLKRKC